MLDSVQIILVILCSIFIANYLYLRWSSASRRKTSIEMTEAFSNQDEDTSVAIYGIDHIYDDFYAKVYDQVVDGKVRQEVETHFTLDWAKSYRPDVKTIQALDVGCGTGGHVNHFRSQGVGKVVGIDLSEAMIRQGREKHPKADLRVGNAEVATTFAAGEFNLITMYYFTYYYLKDRDSCLRNMFLWLQPGSCLVIHGVNREKFDPILEAASPFVGFSVQKYSKERVSRSKVSFDKFDYEADFQHEGSDAKFREEFRFKNGKVRRQIHSLRIPTMEEMVAEVESAGFTYKKFIDMTSIGYEYQYLFCFIR
jgi:ubiquinone/menaquinone biosynthesis C-methylase UbiE